MDVFSRDDDAESGTPITSLGVPLLLGIANVVELGGAVTIMASSDGGAWAATVLYNGRRVGRLWVRTVEDGSWLCECLESLDADSIQRAWDASHDQSEGRGSSGLNKAVAKRSSKR